jgi:hypothetical protein
MCGWLNTVQIIKLMFPPDPSTGRTYQLQSAQGQRRIQSLTKEGLLIPTIPLIEVGKGKDPNVHTVSKKAIETGITDGPLIARPNVRSDFYPHEKGLRDVVTDILRCATLHNIHIPTFKRTGILKNEYEPYKADWYFAIAFDDGNPYHIFLEYDRVEESEVKWKTKLARINTYLDSQEYKDIYKYHRVRIITVTTGQKHMETMMKWTHEAGGRARFWFTTTSKLTPDTALTMPIWSVCGQEGLHPLNKTGNRP